MANRQQRPARPTRGTHRGAGAQPADPGLRQSLHFSTMNLALGVAGLATLALGYWFLANGSITAAPLLLVLGYVVLLPLALIL